MKRLGLVVNPIAGMGGRVGLKGTDGEDTLRRALELGAKPVAPSRAVEALLSLKRTRVTFQLMTYPKDMGEEEAQAAGLPYQIVGSLASERTTAEDTKNAALGMERREADLILFVGGDGTARDICDAVGTRVPALGIPSGVKVYSGAFATNPITAGMIAARYIEGELALHDAEVMDIDEESYRQNRLTSKLFCYLRVPLDRPLVQNVKLGSPLSEDEVLQQEAIAKSVIEEMDRESLYILGPGSTIATIAKMMGIRKTLLGVDVVRGGRLVASDASEDALMRITEEGKTKIVVTPIGGQGFIFGRGNQQISPELIRRVGKENITVVATKHKLATLTPRRLLVDTGNSEVDAKLCGYAKVVTGYREVTVVPVE